MTRDPLALLRLLQLASPALPIGAYSYSQGLEAAVEAGYVQRRGSRAGVDRRPARALRSRAGGAGAAAPGSAGASDARRRALERLLRRHRARPRELRAETLQMGRLAGAAARRDLGDAQRADCATSRRAARPRSRSPRARWGIAPRDALARVSLVVAREPGDGGGEGGAARPDRRPAHAARARRADPGGGRARACAARRRHRQLRARASRSRRRGTKRSTRGSSAHEALMTAARRHRRPGRLGQDRADARAVPRAARPLRHRRRHQRHLHRGGRAVPGAQRARCAPERIIGVETGGCPHTAIREDASINLEAVDRLMRRFPQPRPRLRRERRRQPRRDLQPGAVRPDALRDRRRRRRQDPAQGRPRHHHAPTCSSSTRSTSRRWSARRSR